MGKLEIVLTEDALYDVDLNDVFAPVDSGCGQLVRFSCVDTKPELFAAINGGGESVTKIFNQIVEITGIIITSAEVPINRNRPEEGNINKPCVNIFTTEGDHYASISNGVVRATKNMLGMGILPSPDSPVPVIFKQINTPKGMAHTFDLAYDFDAEV